MVKGGGVKFTPRVSRVLHQIETKFQRLPHVLGVKRFNGANADIVKPTAQPEIQYGSHKTEGLTTQAVYQIEPKFKRPVPCFLALPIQ
jgi:hypothetical protein